MSFRCTLAFVLLSALAAPGALRAAEPTAQLRFDAAGIQIDAGSVGQFTLDYPALLDSAQKPIRQLVEKNATAKRAALKYEGGLQLDLTLGENGKVQLKFSDAPADVKNLEWNMHIPISFNQGGQWKAGTKGGDFPKEKPAKPHLYQDHAESIAFTNYEGRSLVLAMPPYTFYQLSDNREWSWAIFHFKGVTPFAADRKELTLTISLQGGAGESSPLVDELGQSARETWPDKVKSVAG